MGYLALGLDFGTSGARLAAIDPAGDVVAQSSIAYETFGPADDPETWRAALGQLLGGLTPAERAKVRSIAIDGTSATVLLTDRSGQILTPPLLYHDGRGAAVLDQVKAIAPEGSPAIGASSALAKVLWWRDHHFGGSWPQGGDTPFIFHQADWLAWLLHDQRSPDGRAWTDYHNALKLGGDPLTLTYPETWQGLDFWRSLPAIVPPGQAIGSIQPSIAETFGLPSHCLVCAGTTDSNAAVWASGIGQPGEAVTSLGSTLVIKLLTRQAVQAPALGVYSHRWPGQTSVQTHEFVDEDRSLWLAGGASNAGGAVLRQFFSDEDLIRLSRSIDPHQASPLDYYPLLRPGDRFPINDPHLPPRLEPRPDNPVAFLHGLLESLARLEALGYQTLANLGGDRLTRVVTAGGGAANPAWTAIRSRLLGVPVVPALAQEAAIGAAKLAQIPLAQRPID